jgi:predicted DNA-binding transcriptional regulator YafY
VATDLGTFRITTASILRILELIQSQGLWTTKALAEELEYSARTDYRYLDVLKYADVP